MPSQKHKKGKNQAKKAAQGALLIREALIHGGSKLDDAATVALLPAEALTYHCKGQPLAIEVCTAPKDLPAATKEAVFALTEANMKALYVDSKDHPWNSKEKHAELFSPTSRMLLVRSPSGTVEAFVHYRFEEDDEGAWYQCIIIRAHRELEALRT